MADMSLADRLPEVGDLQPMFDQDSPCPVWTPFGQYEAARTLHELLRSEDAAP